MLKKKKKSLRRGTRLQREATTPELSANTLPPTRSGCGACGAGPPRECLCGLTCPPPPAGGTRSSLATRPEETTVHTSHLGTRLLGELLRFARGCQEAGIQPPRPSAIKVCSPFAAPLSPSATPLLRRTSALGLKDHRGVPGSLEHKHTHQQKKAH